MINNKCGFTVIELVAILTILCIIAITVVSTNMKGGVASQIVCDATIQRLNDVEQAAWNEVNESMEDHSDMVVMLVADYTIPGVKWHNLENTCGVMSIHGITMYLKRTPSTFDSEGYWERL